MSDQVEAEDSGRARVFTGKVQAALTFLCVAIAVWHLYVAVFPIVSSLTRNAIHYAGFAFLAAVFTPAIGRGNDAPRPLLYIDAVFGALVAVSAVYLAEAETAIYDRGVTMNALDWTAALIAIAGAVELTRRVAGPVIPVLILLALTYVGLWGAWVPGVFRFSGLSWETVIFRSIYGDDAMFGTIARISATYVFLFIIFGAFLLRSGAGEFVISLARAVAGKLIGGPGLVAVIASSLTGTISGSAVANTASTGVITIPLMKKAGFRPQFAGGVEAASSTGGQLMPPIMGAGAFAMASLTQIPYETIVAVAALPALLYFLSVAYLVRIEAKRTGMQPMPSEGETIGSAFRKGGASFVIPITLLIGMLVSGFTPTYAAVFGIAAVIASSWLTSNPMGPRAVYEALALGTRNMVMTAVILCAVGLIVNVIATAGVGNTFSLMIAEWSGGNLLVALILVAIASLVLGMGLPVTAAYIVLATLSAPALSGMIEDRAVVAAMAAGELGQQASAVVMLASPELAQQITQAMPVSEAWAIVRELPIEVAQPLRDQVVGQGTAMAALLSAHMIIFWLSQDSNVTPPVALAAFTAAAIAKSPAMRTGVQSWKLAKGLYIVPVLFAYTPLATADPGAAIRVFAFAVVGIYGLSAALQGATERRIGWGMRAVLAAAGVAAMWPGMLWMSLAGVAVIVALVAWTCRGTTQGQPA